MVFAGARGTIKLLLGVRPLTYILNGPVIMQRLPHQISFWVIAFVKPDDTKVMQVTFHSSFALCLFLFRLSSFLF